MRPSFGRTILIPRKRYPVIVHIYGGPHSLMVLANSRRYLLDQWLADQGFIIVAIDGRGTPCRGRDFERAIKGNFVDVSLADQVRGLKALGKKYPELDLGSVGIFGWSFGGYMSAMAVMKRPDVFHAGIAGAPVVDWLDYDTHYTERYLGLPEKNKSGYDASSRSHVRRQAQPAAAHHPRHRRRQRLLPAQHETLRCPLPRGQALRLPAPRRLSRTWCPTL